MGINLTGRIDKLRNSNKAFFLGVRFLDHQGCTYWGFQFHSNLRVIRDQ